MLPLWAFAALKRACLSVMRGKPAQFSSNKSPNNNGTGHVFNHVITISPQHFQSDEGMKFSKSNLFGSRLSSFSGVSLTEPRTRIAGVNRRHVITTGGVLVFAMVWITWKPILSCTSSERPPFVSHDVRHKYQTRPRILSDAEGHVLCAGKGLVSCPSVH